MRKGNVKMLIRNLRKMENSKELARRIVEHCSNHPSILNENKDDIVNDIIPEIEHFINQKPLPSDEIECKACGGSKEIEVLVMGTDTEIVKCYHCGGIDTITTIYCNDCNMSM